MSCYEWERGTIIIPTKEWAGFRKGLLEAWNKRQLELLERAVRIHGLLKAAVKGKRGSTRDKALADALKRHVGDEYSDANEDLRNLLVDSKWEGRVHTRTLKGVPKKKDLKLFAVSKDADLHLPDASVSLRNKGRTVTWDVGENNHACDHAREHWFAKLLFDRLNRITWTRGTGGKIIGNNEYNRDRDDEGGGGNLLVCEYRMLSAKEKREAEERRRAANRYGGGYGYGRRW